MSSRPVSRIRISKLIHRMSVAVLRFIIFVSVVYCSNCKADSSLNYDDELGNNGNVIQKSLEIDFQRKKTSILKAASDVIDSQTISDMINQLKNFSHKFPKEFLNQKPVKAFIRKFEGDLKTIGVKGKMVFQMARKLEKSGKKRSKKQLAAFETELKSFEKLVKKIVKSACLETKRQRNKNLKIVRDHANDINILGNAKKCVNVADLFSGILNTLQSIPDKINCLIFGCEASGDVNDNNEGDNNAEGNDDDDDDAEGEPSDDDPSENGPDEGPAEPSDAGLDPLPDLQSL